MRREFRKKKKQNDNIIMYSVAGALVLITIVFALIMYGNTINNNVKNSQLSSDQIASILGNETDSESASTDIGKTVEEQEKEQSKQETVETKTEINNKENISNTTNAIENQNSTYTQNSNVSTTANTNTNTNSNLDNTTQATNAKTSGDTAKKELSFQMPVEGEIVCEFTQDNLVFSETLQEWVTHDGIDIKADKTTVVQAAEEGTVKSIKNDPRYGLTIIIEHEDGFQTIYANLLSTEFVTEGEKVEKGQSIGTIGNTAAFESADEPHLHFEMIKESVKVNPSLYVK